MSWFVVDVESDGPIPHKHSMVCFGAVPVLNNVEQSFNDHETKTAVINRREEIKAKLVKRRRDQGYNLDESKRMLDKLLRTHSGGALVTELTFNSFATPFTAAKLTAEWDALARELTVEPLAGTK